MRTSCEPTSRRDADTRFLTGRKSEPSPVVQATVDQIQSARVKEAPWIFRTLLIVTSPSSSPSGFVCALQCTGRSLRCRCGSCAARATPPATGMSSPSKRPLGKSSRSELGSTGLTPAKAQQPRGAEADGADAAPADAGASPADMAVDADAPSVPASGGAAAPTPRADDGDEAPALPTGGSEGKALHALHAPLLEPDCTGVPDPGASRERTRSARLPPRIYDHLTPVCAVFALRRRRDGPRRSTRRGQS